jgi:hypothetical protein
VTQHTHFGIINEDGLSLRYPRPVDEVFNTLVEAFAEAARMLIDSEATRVAVVSARRRDDDDDWVEVTGLALLEAYPSLQELEA